MHETFCRFWTVYSPQDELKRFRLITATSEWHPSFHQCSCDLQRARLLKWKLHGPQSPHEVLYQGISRTKEFILVMSIGSSLKGFTDTAASSQGGASVSWGVLPFCFCSWTCRRIHIFICQQNFFFYVLCSFQGWSSTRKIRLQNRLILVVKYVK